MRGRPPKPREQRIREGKAGHRPLPEPVLVSGRPRLGELDEPPAHLEPDAAEFWRTTVGRLVEVGLVDRVDVPALEMLATQYGRVQALRRVIGEVGYFAKGSRGQIAQHPAVSMEREAARLFMAIAEQFALTATSRARLGLAELHRRTLQKEMAEQLGKPDLRPINGRAAKVSSN